MFVGTENRLVVAKQEWVRGGMKRRGFTDVSFYIQIG